jgi:hypothetical protein
MIAPLFPLPPIPVLNTIIPLTPLSPLAVLNTKSPLLDDVPLPLVIITDPPVAADDNPADNNN